MKSGPDDSRLVTRYHTIVWTVVLIWFSATLVTQFFFDGWTDYLALAGLCVLVLATLGRAVVMAVHFNRASDKSKRITSLILIFLVLIAALIGYFKV